MPQQVIFEDYSSDEEYERSRRPHGTRHASNYHSHAQYADDTLYASGGDLHRARSHGHTPKPTINIYNSMDQENVQRAAPSQPARGRSSIRSPAEAYIVAPQPPVKNYIKVEKSRSRSRSHSHARSRSRSRSEVHRLEAQIAELQVRQRAEDERRAIAEYEARMKEHEFAAKKAREAALKESELRSMRRDQEEKSKEEMLTLKLKANAEAAKKAQEQAVKDYQDAERAEKKRLEEVLLKRKMEHEEAEAKEKEMIDKFKRKEEEREKKKKDEEEEAVRLWQKKKEEQEKKKKEEEEEAVRKWQKKQEDDKKKEEEAMAEYARKLKEKEDKKKKEEEEKEKEYLEQFRKDMLKLGYTYQQIENMIAERKGEQLGAIPNFHHDPHVIHEPIVSPGISPHRHGHGGELIPINLGRPTYSKVRRKDIEIETLKYYDLPYELDRRNHEYFVILQELNDRDWEILFEHTRRLRAKKPVLAIEENKRDKEFAFVRHRSRSRGKSPMSRREKLAERMILGMK